MGKSHEYEVEVTWTGNRGTGTSDYRAFGRDHQLRAGEKQPLSGSADPAFRGDPARYNPEELLVGSLSACHMLWYLHLCSDAGVVVEAYSDNARGTMTLSADGGGRFSEVVLRPHVVIAPGNDADVARRLHKQAHELCFIANSVNFDVRCDPLIE